MDESLEPLDWTVEIHCDVWERVERHAWCFYCPVLDIFLEFSNEATARAFKGLHECQHSSS